LLLSVLDLSPVPSGTTATEALRQTLDLARHVDALGLERYWLAEHHNAGSLASSAPEILIAEVASVTHRIRVGAGGIMLPNHSPLKVAECFRVLEALHPGRIDLGIGRAAGTDQKTALALRQSRELLPIDLFPAQLDELLAYLRYEPDPHVRFGPTKAVPIGVAPPPVFLLSSGMDGSALAARLGLGLAYAHHIGPDEYAASMRAYRETFQPSAWAARPYAILATSVFCAATDAAAEDLVRCASLSVLRAGQGLRDLPFPSVAEARAYAFDADEEALRRGGRTRFVAGEPARVADVLREMALRSGADELMIATMMHDHEERKRSYERVVRALR
jgi:luciferase family oxidoreductase group 1